ncbi:MAG: hypothetical protein U0670_16785 [Anaerolineae bacterium]
MAPAPAFLETEYVTLQYLPDKQCLYHVAQTYPNDQQFKNALNAGAAALEKYKINKWVSDDRKLGPMSPDLLQWGATEFNPRAIAAGWRFWANVVPEQVATATDTFAIMETLFEFGLRMMVFTNTQEAFEWIDKVDVPHVSV